jgi:hypothetical protein
MPFSCKDARGSEEIFNLALKYTFVGRLRTYKGMGTKVHCEAMFFCSCKDARGSEEIFNLAFTFYP